MNKEFTPYEIALELKELGFDEPCFAFYDESLYFPNNENQYGTFCNQKLDVPSCSAPLNQQIFRWFEKEHDLYIQRIVTSNVNEILGINYSIVSWKFPPIEIVFENPYDCFDKDKAESVCIDKLIEIVKKYKQ